MSKHIVVSTLCAAVSLCLNFTAASAHESRWVRWPAAAGVVQHIITNDSNQTSEMTVSSLLSGSCDRSARSTYPANDKRFSSRVSLELQPRAWVAIWALIAERSIGCRAELVLAGAEGSSALTSTALKPEVEFVEVLPYEAGEVHIDTSVVLEDLLNAFEPQGTNLQVQLRVRNISSDLRTYSVIGRHLECGAGTNFDWVVGPGEAPVQISSGPIVVKPKAAVVFSQRLRGSGDSSVCTASFTIAEARRPYEAPHVEHEEPPVWHAIKNVSVRLSPTVKAYYR
ncbi:MAG TPA: hypothetical protein VF226_17185 [Hyphomicrobiaceae bacterium]